MIVEAGGGTVEDIAKVTVWMRDPADRKVLNREWLKMFPDEASRPARHTQGTEPGDEALIRCEFVAVLGG
jgi:enamine deaminase RidA (YjgF/YER057c/UK114 family)